MSTLIFSTLAAAGAGQRRGSLVPGHLRGQRDEAATGTPGELRQDITRRYNSFGN